VEILSPFKSLLSLTNNSGKGKYACVYQDGVMEKNPRLLAQRSKLLGNLQLQKSVTTLFGQADTLLHVSFVP
jgi:hypothetical protein